MVYHECEALMSFANFAHGLFNNTWCGDHKAYQVATMGVPRARIAVLPLRHDEDSQSEEGFVRFCGCVPMMAPALPFCPIAARVCPVPRTLFPFCCGAVTCSSCTVT